MINKIFVVLFLAFSLPVFSQVSLLNKAGSVEVVSITGNVKYEVSQDVWELVTDESELTLDTNIHTGLNSTLVIETADKVVITIKSMKKGPVKEFLDSSQSSSNGITLDGNFTMTEASDEELQERTNISTASTRASDATEDLEWVDEEEETEE